MEKGISRAAKSSRGTNTQVQSSVPPKDVAGGLSCRFCATTGVLLPQCLRIPCLDPKRSKAQQNTTGLLDEWFENQSPPADSSHPP